MAEPKKSAAVRKEESKEADIAEAVAGVRAAEDPDVKPSEEVEKEKEAPRKKAEKVSERKDTDELIREVLPDWKEGDPLRDVEIVTDADGTPRIIKRAQPGAAA